MPERPAVKTPAELRSARWFAPDDFRSFGHRSRAMQMGYAPEDWEGRPVIAILNTWSEARPCHAHFKHRVDGAVLMGGRDFDFLEKGFGPATGEPDIY